MKSIGAQSNKPTGGLGRSARIEQLKSCGAMLVKDAAQFCVMLVLVRMLLPADNGEAVLAQSMTGLAGAIAY